jgi:hypothetical protein
MTHTWPRRHTHTVPPRSQFKLQSKKYYQQFVPNGGCPELDDEENLQETTIFDGKNHGFNMFQH